MTKTPNTSFQIDDPSLESQWRAIILFGKNSATYKFAFAKTLLDLVEQEKTTISIEDLSLPYAKHLIEHLKKNDKQGNSNSSTFLNGCRKFMNGEISEDELFQITKKHGFANVIDAFQNVNGAKIPNIFYEKDFSRQSKQLVITDNLLKLKEKFQFQNLEHEVEARWDLVETAWNLNINPNLLEVSYDEDKELFFVENNIMRRKDVTSVREALNGYQKGECFYSKKEITISSKTENTCAVDHFIPHILKPIFSKKGININGVWNLVLADSKVNSSKSNRLAQIRFLERLYQRNEYYIESNLPLAETIINQTGKTKAQRREFLIEQYQTAVNELIDHSWQPDIELIT